MLRGGYLKDNKELWIGYVESQGGEQFNRDYHIPAPLYQQAFSWFRQKGIDFEIYERYKDLGKFYGGYIKENKDITPKSFGSNFKTYEEAELDCLDKLIDLCKKNKL